MAPASRRQLFHYSHEAKPGGETSALLKAYSPWQGSNCLNSGGDIRIGLFIVKHCFAHFLCDALDLLACHFRIQGDGQNFA